MLTRPSMCVRLCLVIVALGLTFLKPFPAPVGFAATPPSTPTAGGSTELAEVGMAPVAIAAVSSPATGKFSAPAGTAAASLPLPAGADHWPAAIEPASLPAAGSLPVPAAAVASPLPAAGTVSVPPPALPFSATIPVDLALLADPGWAEPGDIITLTAVLASHSAVSAPAGTLSSTLPASLVIVPGSAAGFEVGPGPGALHWQTPPLAAGQAVTASVQAQLAGVAPGQVVTASLTAAGDGSGPVVATAGVTVVGPAADTIWITPGAGGRLRTRDSRVVLSVPAGAVTADVQLAYTPTVSGPAPPPGTVVTFTLTATDAGGQPGGAFRRAGLLRVAAGPAAVPPARLVLRQWDAVNGVWQEQPAPAVRHGLAAWIDRGGVYAVTIETTPSYGIQHLPTVHGFVTDEWTGNSRVDYPLAVPPGPGGLGLGLGLSYSSEGVNSIRQGPTTYHDPNTGSVVYLDQQNGQNFSRQAGMAGWGWSLAGLGAVTVDFSSSRAYLSFGGGSAELRYLDGAWQSDPQQFWRIERAADSVYQAVPWYVWTKDGTRYTFEPLAWNLQVIAGQECSQRLREFPLTEVWDTHGNHVVITYDQETFEPAGCENGSIWQRRAYVRAVRPLRLAYFPHLASGADALSTVHVDFGYGTRTDTGVPGAGDPYTEALWSNYRLTSITMQVRTGSGSEDFTTARSYHLGQEYLWQDQAAGKGLLLLTSLSERGRDGGTLPAWSFDYTAINGWLNHTVLQTAGNGRGGSAAWSYSNVPNIWMEGCGGNTSRYRVTALAMSDGQGWSTTTTYDTHSTRAWAWSGPGLPECPGFEFGGFDQVRRDLANGAGTVVQVVTTSFHQRDGSSLDPRKGKVYLSETRGQVSGSMLASTATTWDTTLVRGTSWVSKRDETATVGGVSRKTAYEYQASSQGGVQFGNVTLVKEYIDAGSTLNRTQATEYFPNNVPGSAGSQWSGAVYIVDRPMRQVLADGGGTCQGETRLLYDGNASYYAPPARGDLTQTRVAQTACGGSWRDTAYVYDAWGNPVRVTDPGGNITTTDFDTSATTTAWPRLYAYTTAETLPTVGGVNFTTTYAWNKILGQVESVTDFNGATAQYRYDQWGRLLKQWRPGDSETCPTVGTAYTDGAPTVVETRQRENQPASGCGGVLKSFEYYDGLGRVIETQTESANTATANVISRWYGPAGHVRLETVPYAVAAAPGAGLVRDSGQPATATQVDALGRVTLVTSPDGSTVSTSYQGLVSAIIDEGGRRREQETDPFGRLVEVREYTGTGGATSLYATTQYSYDVRDALTDVWDTAGHHTGVGYDLLGQKLWLDDPDLGRWTYAYDGAGNLARQTDARNQSVCFYYDAQNRPLGKAYRTGINCPGSPPVPLDVSYSYDAATGGNAGIGRRTSMVDGSGSTTWVYDARGRVSAEAKTIDGVAYTTSFTYDAADRVVTASYPGGETVTTGYDGQGLPTGLYGWNTYVSQATYDAASRPELVTLGSGLITDYDYYPWTQASGRGRLQRLAVGTLMDWRYTYDVTGNVKTIRDVPNNDQRQCFGYDDLDRLTSAFTGNATCTTYSSAGLAPYSQTYTYDATGNLMSKSDVGAYTYNAPVSGCTSGTQTTKPHAVRQAGSGSFVYDCTGNITQRTMAGRVQTLAYDAESRLVSVSDNELTTSFVYDGDGRRVKKLTSWATTVYVSDNYEQTTASAGMGVLAGDTNADCKLDIVDIQSVASVFGQAWSAANARYDVNQDGALDIEDVQAVASNWQMSIPGPCNRLTKRYYRLGGQLIAVRVNGELNYLHGDHLGSVSLLTDAAGQKVGGSEQRFHPFGTVRAGQPAFYPTERGYTGQRLDLSTDLMYYEARYYDPLLARFVQADTIVPGAGSSQGLNRYSYSSSSPVNLVDSNGHCPAPPENSGDVICVDFFIQSATIFFGFGQGDGRTFDSNSKPTDSRAYFYIFLDKEGKVRNIEEHVNPSCTPAGCIGPFHKYNHFTVVQDSDLDMTITWELVNGISGSMKSAADVLRWKPEGPWWFDNSLFETTAAWMVDAASHIIPSIDGMLEVGLISDKYQILAVDRDPYPSLEVYRYHKGVPQADLYRALESNLGTWLGLSALAPNERYSRPRDK